MFHKAVPDKFYGAWMKDSHPLNNVEAEKIWVTREESTDSLYEYMNKDDFRKNTNAKKVPLTPRFQVSGRQTN